MKSKTTKKPAAKSAAKKTTAKASAARVPSVVIKKYPHVLHVHVNGEEYTALRSFDLTEANIARERKILAHVHNLAGPESVVVENLDARGNIISP